MAIARLCPRCGRREEENEFVEGFCPLCFPQVRELAKVPPKLEVPECPRCGRAFFAGEWQKLDDEALCRLLVHKVRSAYDIAGASARTEGEGRSREAVLKLELEVEGRRFKHEVRIPFPVTKGLCSDDSRKAAGYYEAIIQLRGEPERVMKTAERFGRRLKSLGSFVTKVERLHGGLDVYVGGKAAAREAVGELGHFDSSRTLAGMRGGKRVYRVTYIVRV